MMSALRDKISTRQKKRTIITLLLHNTLQFIHMYMYLLVLIIRMYISFVWDCAVRSYYIAAGARFSVVLTAGRYFVTMEDVLHGYKF